MGMRYNSANQGKRGNNSTRHSFRVFSNFKKRLTKLKDVATDRFISLFNQGSPIPKTEKFCPSQTNYFSIIAVTFFIGKIVSLIQLNPRKNGCQGLNILSGFLLAPRNLRIMALKELVVYPQYTDVV